MNHATAAQLLTASREELAAEDEFIHRHLGIDPAAEAEMLAALKVASVQELIDQTVPSDIRLPAPLALPAACPEAEALARLRALFAQNRDKHPLIGQGYYGTHLPPVLLRNVFENPGWYTAYTPYQAEISQGRLEVLLHFQHMVADLTGLPVANASLLDEVTAAAEAMSMCRRASKSASKRFFVDSAVFVQTLDVLKTRAPFFGIELIVAPANEAAQHDVFGALLQSPNRHGEFIDHSATIAALHEQGALVAVACDLMALVLCKTPGEMGADIALGSAQRFGIPMGFGGPHAAFFAAR
ncbi:MAG: glycine dehydrogenase (aminomethyl-transferring), partial [Rhodocyclaceae bacterium]|nr:glycine dehydrogenase (aminomethyl-transferring) [Rhodocyclaceae bacterium]